VAKFYVGLDLGQSRDYTAVVVAEKIEPSGASGRDYELHIRHLERFKDVLYPDVAERVRRLIDAPELHSKAALTVDATGVGAPVVDMLSKSDLTFDAVTITGGDTESQQGWYAWRVPKRDLIGGLQVLLQSGRLKIAYTLEHAETLKSELLNFRLKVNVSTGHDSYEAWREGDHDDLVLAAALAAWRATRIEYIGPTIMRW
jgi:phage FluMu gp28-like protein